MDAVEMLLLFDYYGDMLTERQRMCLDLRYNQDLSLAEISEHEGISRQGVRDHIKRGEVYMAELEEKLHFAKKFQELLAVSDEVLMHCENIARVNNGFMQSQAIAQSAESIYTLISSYIDKNF